MNKFKEYIKDMDLWILEQYYHNIMFCDSDYVLEIHDDKVDWCDQDGKILYTSLNDGTFKQNESELIIFAMEQLDLRILTGCSPERYLVSLMIEDEEKCLLFSDSLYEALLRVFVYNHYISKDTQ